MSTKVLEDIREELLEIKPLYKELVDKLIPTNQRRKEGNQRERRNCERTRINGNP